MKPFDIEKAKNGAAVCLSDGTPVKILDFDFNGDILYKTFFTDDDGNIREGTVTVDQKGKRGDRNIGYDCKELNLYMSPVCGYMVLYMTETKELVGGQLYSEKNKAEQEAASQKDNDYVNIYSLAKVEILDD